MICWIAWKRTPSRLKLKSETLLVSDEMISNQRVCVVPFAALMNCDNHFKMLLIWLSRNLSFNLFLGALLFL